MVLFLLQPLACLQHSLALKIQRQDSAVCLLMVQHLLHPQQTSGLKTQRQGMLCLILLA